MNTYCDTLNHPIVKTARGALEKGDITPILKWMKEEKGNEIQDLFEKTLIVRNKGEEAQEIADRYFLETLVRLHRAGEDEPYDGLKPAGVVEADKTGIVSVDTLVKLITEETTNGIRERFDKVKKARKHTDHIEADREYAEAYVEFTHYAEWCILILQRVQDIITGRTQIIQSDY